MDAKTELTFLTRLLEYNYEKFRNYAATRIFNDGIDTVSNIQGDIYGNTNVAGHGRENVGIHRILSAIARKIGTRSVEYGAQDSSTVDEPLT